MIQIKRDNLDSLANEHYNRVLKTGLIDFLNKKAKIKGKLQPFYQRLLHDVDLKNGKSIITAEPKELQRQIKKYNKEFGLDFSRSKNINIRRRIKMIFDYKSYIAEHGYWLAKELNVNVCPYCNRQYTFIVGDDKKKAVRPEFDHFFNQKKYPYLSLSFYNFVPSCPACNRLKKEIDFSVDKSIHPYLKGFDSNAKFSTKLKGIEAIWGDSTAIELLLNPEKKGLSEKNIEVFKLRELYNGYDEQGKNELPGHRDYVVEIIQKALIYNASYIDELFDTYQGVFFKTREDAARIVLSNYISEDDLEKRVLSKLTKDISEEWGLFS